MSKKIGDKPELLTKEEMQNLLLVVSNNIYFNTLYNVLLHTGRRIGEIYGTPRRKNLTGGIRVCDIDFNNKIIKTIILKTKKRKLQILCPSCYQKTSYKSKYCPFCSKELPVIDKNKLKYDEPQDKFISLKQNLIILLQTYIKNTKLKSNQYLFREYSLVYLKKVIKKHIKEAGIKKNFSLHGFRHYFITQCKIAGLSNEDIAKWTGHVRTDTLNLYDQRVAKDVEEKISKVELI